jgi:hypothetical protein
VLLLHKERDVTDGVISSSLDPAPFFSEKISSSFVVRWILSGRQSVAVLAGAGRSRPREKKKKKKEEG